MPLMPEDVHLVSFCLEPLLGTLPEGRAAKQVKSTRRVTYKRLTAFRSTRPQQQHRDINM